MNFFVTIVEEFHIIKNLSCFIMINTNIIKSYNISSRWNFNDKSNTILIQNIHEIQITIVKKEFMKITQIQNFTKILLFMFIKTKILKTSKQQQINVYVKNFVILKESQKRNVKMTHKSLTKEFYVFEAIRKQNFDLNIYFFQNQRNNFQQYEFDINREFRNCFNENCDETAFRSNDSCIDRFEIHRN